MRISEGQIIRAILYCYRFDRDVYEGMAVCHGKVVGDLLTVVDPNRSKAPNGNPNNGNGAGRHGNEGLIVLFVLFRLIEVFLNLS